MKIISVILIGITSIFGSCNKTVPSVQFKLYANGVLSNGHWSQISGPSTLIFDNNDTSIVNVTTNNPQIGVYVLKGDIFGVTDTAIITVIK